MLYTAYAGPLGLVLYTRRFLTGFLLSDRQASAQGNDNNWLPPRFKGSQNLQNIQDQMQDYQTTNWKETPYLDHGESMEFQPTDAPHVIKRTIIPAISENVRPDINTEGG